MTERETYYAECDTCDGEGRIPDPYGDEDGPDIDCPDCEGEGQIEVDILIDLTE